MFEKLFAPKPRVTPKDFSDALLTFWRGEDVNKGREGLKLSDSQCKRYLFSTFIFVAMLPMTLAAMRRRNDLATYLPEVFALNMALMAKAWKHNEAVRLGDIIRFFRKDWVWIEGFVA